MALAAVTALLLYAEVEVPAPVQVTALLFYAELEPGTAASVSLPSALPAATPLPELFDSQGRRLTYMTGFQASRAFLINDIGSGEIAVASNVNWAGFLEPDRLVLIRSADGLPDWGGLIVEVERTFGRIVARLREALIMLSAWNGFGYPITNYPEGLPEQRSETNTPQALITAALQRVFVRNTTRLRLGTLALTANKPITISHTKTKTVLDEINELHDAFGFDFWTEPYLDNSQRLAFKLHIQDRRVRERESQVVLWEGYSLGPGSRRKVISTQFGLSPNKLLEAEVTQTSLWPYLRLGDIIGVRSSSLDFSGRARILGMEPDDINGKLSLVLEVEG